MDIMFSEELARRLAGTGVTANSCDPGFNTTGLGRDLPGAGILATVLTRAGIGDPRRGAGIIVRLATDPAFATFTGGYCSVKNARVLQCPPPGRGADIQRELGDETSRFLEKILEVTL